MNVVDSSAWLEYFGDGPNAGEFADAIAETEHLIVPGITLFEVFKRIRLQRDLDAARSMPWPRCSAAGSWTSTATWPLPPRN